MGQPALVINRWSGDGKAEAVGLADAARERGIRVTMLERGDDLTGLAEAAPQSASRGRMTLDVWPPRKPTWRRWRSRSPRLLPR